MSYIKAFANWKSDFGQVESFLVLDFAASWWRCTSGNSTMAYSWNPLPPRVFVYHFIPGDILWSILICPNYFNLVPEKLPGDEVVVVYLNRSGNDHVSFSFKIKSNIKITPWKGIHHSQGFWSLGRGFRLPCEVLYSSLCHWNLDSGFLELYFGFQSPGSRIPWAKISSVPESGFPFIGVSGTYLCLGWVSPAQGG